MNKKATTLAIAMFFAIAFSAQTASAQNNEPPPSGAILDLGGTPIPGGGDGVTYQHYTVNFHANLSQTDITFALREDPAFISLTDITVTDIQHGNQVLQNGNFQGGVYCDNGNCGTPVDWMYANIFGAFAGGQVSTGCSPSPSGNTDCFFDGAVQAYDAIDQVVTTTMGDDYQISFYVADDSNCETDGGPPCNFMDLSNNGQPGTGGNGIDVLVYAQAGLPPPGVPEPSSLLMFGTGVLGLAGVARRKLGF